MGGITRKYRLKDLTYLIVSFWLTEHTLYTLFQIPVSLLCVIPDFLGGTQNSTIRNDCWHMHIRNFQPGDRAQEFILAVLKKLHSDLIGRQDTVCHLLNLL